MFNTDKPIEKMEEDLLNRATFSRELANAILAYTDTENFAISLCGEWGCGKTSILHMVVQEIRRNALHMENDERPIIIHFNPWNYSDKNQLITQFFREIFIALKKEGNNEKLKQAGDALQKYSSIFDYAKYIPKIGEFIALLKPIIEGIGKQMADISEDVDSIENQKNLVIKVLRELKQKIIVIIDDIDRLNNEQIRLIFQLVNSVAGFPNMIYLLSFDRRVVVRALSEEQDCDGEEYLEKIIQVPFDVPEAKAEHIHNVLFRELEKIVDVPDDRFDSEHWNIVFRECISKFAHSIRDVNRIINSYKLKYALMHTETDWADLLCITTLQICAPEIYKWIRDNLDKLVGISHPSLSLEKKRRTRGEYLEKFGGIYEKSPERMLKIIQALFPNFAWITEEYVYSNITAEKLRYLQRIASPAYSNLYFHLSLDDVKVDRNDVLKSISEYGKTELHLYLEKLKENDCMQTYLQELICCIDKISDEKIELFFYEIMDIQLETIETKTENQFTPSNSFDCRLFIWALLKKSNNEICQKLLCKYIAESDKEKFLLILEYIKCIEEAYGRIGQETDHYYRVISEEALEEIEKECHKKLKHLNKDDTLLDSDNFYNLMAIWKHIDKDEFNEYMLLCLKDEKNVPKFLYFASGFWHGGVDSGWSFNEKNVSQYLTMQDMYNRVQALKRTEKFNALRDEQQQVAVAFSLWYESENKEDYHNLSKKNVNELLPTWIKND